jgi:predicted HTH domain antitoxin
MQSAEDQETDHHLNIAILDNGPEYSKYSRTGEISLSEIFRLVQNQPMEFQRPS